MQLHPSPSFSFGCVLLTAFMSLSQVAGSRGNRVAVTLLKNIHRSDCITTPAHQSAAAVRKMSNSTSPSFESLGIRNTNINAAPGVNLSSEQKVIVGSVLDVSATTINNRHTTFTSFADVPTQSLPGSIYTQTITPLSLHFLASSVLATNQPLCIHLSQSHARQTCPVHINDLSCKET